MDNRTVDHGAMDNGTLGQWKWENRPRGQCTMGQWDLGKLGQWDKGEQWDNGILDNETMDK
jgi:hypothetical protein